MADESSQQGTPTRPVRRSSFAGQTFADIFGSGRPSIARGSTETGNSPPSTSQPVGPISKAAAQAQQRRLSLTTLGLSGSPNQTSAFNSFRPRGDSISSANNSSGDESAIAEEEVAAREVATGSSPTNTPFQRRTSFGARALRDIRGGQAAGGSVPGSPGQNGNKSPPLSSSKGTSVAKNQAQNGTISSRDAKGRGSNEGFNWSDNLRSRAERTSIAGQGGLGFNVGSFGSTGETRSKSIATMEAPPIAPPKPKEKPRPDHFQERILKGDFYMD